MHGEKELRCIMCSTEPLLATYGIDQKQQLFVHIKTHKQGKVISEVFVRGGVVTLRCPKCGRHQTVTMMSRDAELVESTRPRVPKDSS